MSDFETNIGIGLSGFAKSFGEVDIGFANEVSHPVSKNIPVGGIEWPEDGQPVYQEDFVFEQNAISTAIRKRDMDNFGNGIIVGGQVELDDATQELVIHPILAYDGNGQRVETHENERLPYTDIPEDATSTLVLRHTFTTQPNFEDSPNFSVEQRISSFEFLFLTGETLSADDIPLREVTHSPGGNPIYTLGNDLRVFRNRIGKIKQIRSRIQTALENKGTDLNLVEAINQIDQLLLEETQERHNAIEDLSHQIRALQDWTQNYSPPAPQSLIGFWNGQGGTVNNDILGDYSRVSLATESNNIHNYKVPNVDGAFIYVKANFSIEYSFGQNTSKLYIYGNILELTEVYLPGHPSALGHPG
ncbi:MAG: hypothetical protein AAF518_19605, partial [Spirochaetota bacterium]